MPSRKASSSALRASAQRFRQAQQELHQLDYFLKGTVLKRNSSRPPVDFAGQIAPNRLPYDG